MSDPKRWREAEDGELRELVTTLAAAKPTPAMHDAVWSKIASTLPPGPTSGGASGGGSSGGIGGSLGAKIVGGALAVIAAGGIATWLARSPEPVSTAPSAATSSAIAPAASAPIVPPSEAPSAVTVAPEPTPTVVAPSPVRPPARSAPAIVNPPAASSSAPAAPQSSADRLREESEGVRRARQLLREKNPTAALAELDRLARRYPAGPLEEEREVLTIEGLASAGRTDEARRRADRFLMERPQSVHAARVREISRK
jgi:hypothetical protein